MTDTFIHTHSLWLVLERGAASTSLYLSIYLTPSYFITSIWVGTSMVQWLVQLAAYKIVGVALICPACPAIHPTLSGFSSISSSLPLRRGLRDRISAWWRLYSLVLASDHWPWSKEFNFDFLFFEAFSCQVVVAHSSSLLQSYLPLSAAFWNSFIAINNSSVSQQTFLTHSLIVHNNSYTLQLYSLL